ncbi:MAG: hypothetical protein ACYCS7_06045 [Acidimicrobiales bacterium]
MSGPTRRWQAVVEHWRLSVARLPQPRYPPPGTGVLQGCPAGYCSPACRPTCVAGAACGRVIVEVDQDEHDGDRSNTGRSPVVRLRRGQLILVVGHDFGRFSATVLSGELRRLLMLLPRREGDAIN